MTNTAITTSTPVHDAELLTECELSIFNVCSGQPELQRDTIAVEVDFEYDRLIMACDECLEEAMRDL